MMTTEFSQFSNQDTPNWQFTPQFVSILISAKGEQTQHWVEFDSESHSFFTWGGNKGA